MPGLLGLRQACQHRPHRRHLDRVRRDVNSLDPLRTEILQVNLDLVVQLDVVGHVDLDRPVAERLHHLVALELLVFRLIVMPQNDLIDVGLRELLGLDQMFLACPQQVVQKRHVELQYFDEFDDSPVGNVQFAVKVERPRVGVGSIQRDLAIVDVARELRRCPGSFRPWAGRCRSRGGPFPTGSGRLTCTCSMALRQSPSYWSSTSA